MLALWYPSMSAYGATIRRWHIRFEGSVPMAPENCGGGWRRLVPAFVGIVNRHSLSGPE